MSSACRFVRFWTAGVAVRAVRGPYESTRASAGPESAISISDARAAVRSGWKYIIAGSFEAAPFSGGAVLLEVSAPRGTFPSVFACRQHPDDAAVGRLRVVQDSVREPRVVARRARDDRVGRRRIWGDVSVVEDARPLCPVARLQRDGD